VRVPVLSKTTVSIFFEVSSCRSISGGWSVASPRRPNSVRPIPPVTLPAMPLSPMPAERGARAATRQGCALHR
jgi:hypothetical protein